MNLDRVEILASLLGAVECIDDENGIFIIAPTKESGGYMGMGVICTPISGGNDDTRNKLAMVFQRDWPAGTLMQFTQYAGPDVSEFTAKHRALRLGKAVGQLDSAAKDYVGWLRQKTVEPLDPKWPALVRDIRVIVTVQVPFKGAVPSDQDLARCSELQAGWLQALESAGLGGQRMNPKNYIRVMETIFNTSPQAAWRQSPISTYDENEVICAQIIDPGNNIEVDTRGLWLDGKTRVRVLSPKRYPDNIYFGQAARMLTDPEYGNRGIRENCIITLNVWVGDQFSERGAIEKRQMMATQQASTPIARYVRAFRDKKQSLDSVANMLQDGDRVVHAYIGMALITHGENDSPECRKETERRSISSSIAAQSYWRELGYLMMEDSYMVLPFFTQLLPFAADPAIKTALQRYKLMAGRHAACLAPVFSQWRGSGEPIMTLFARDAQPMAISPWDTDESMNFLVAAQSGAGKSVFMQAMTHNFRQIGGRIRIIDVGDSYKNVCEELDGQYMAFRDDEQISINPFPIIRNYQDEEDMLIGLLGAMISPNDGLTDFQMAELRRVLGSLWHKVGREMSITMLSKALMAEGRQEVADMGRQLFPFTEEGVFGRYFSGPNTLAIDNDLVVLELGALKERPLLQRIVLLTLMYQIGQDVYHGDRARRFMMFIDEGWQVIAHDSAADFCERAYRQFRKHGGSIGVITQSVLDVWDTKGGRAIANNTAHYYLLAQKPDAIDQVKELKKLPLDDWGYRMLKTVASVRGHYSEIMCITPKGCGIGRLVLSDYQKIQFSTDATVVAQLKAWRDQGMSQDEAITRYVREKVGRPRK